MTDTLLLTATKALKLDDDIALFEALAKIAKGWRDVFADDPSISSIDALLHRLADDLDSEALAEAFEKAGLEEEFAKLKALVAKVKTAAGKVPDNYKALLRPLSDFPVGVDDASNLIWEIASPGAPGITAPGYSLTLAGQARVEFDAAASWPGTPDAKRLSMAASGEVSAGAEAKVPFKFGVGTGKAEASAHVSLTYFYAPDEDEIYAKAVLERVAKLPNPFELDAVWKQMHGVGDATALDGIVYDFKSAASASVQVTFADAQGLIAGLPVESGLKVGVSATLQSSYALTLKRSDAGVVASLSRQQRTESDFNAALDLTVDISKLTQPIAATLRTAVGDWGAALKKIKPFLSPGELLRKEGGAALADLVADLVDDDGLRDAVVADLNGVLGLGDVDKSKVAGWLTSEVAGALNRGQVLVDGKVDEAVGRVIDLIKVKAPTLASRYGDKLKALVSDRVKDLEKRLATAINSALDDGGDALADALRDIQIKVTGWTGKLDKALAPIRDLLTRYDKLFHDMLAAAEIAAKTKVTARLYREEQRLSVRTIELTGTFGDLTDPARAVFRDLTWGRLQALEELIEGTRHAQGFELDRTASSIQRVSEIHSEEGAEIAFVNVLISARAVISGSVTTKVDGHGDLIVTVQANLIKILLSWFNRKEVSFASTYKLIKAGQMSQAAGAAVVAPSMDINIGALYAEKSLDPGDVREFVTSLEDAGLVSNAVLPKIMASYQQWREAVGPTGKLPAEISAVLRLKGETLLAFSKSDSDIVKRAITEATQAKLFKAAKFQKGARIAAQNWYPEPGPAIDDLSTISLGYLDGLSRFDFSERVPSMPPRHSQPIMFHSEDEVVLDEFFAKAFKLKCLVALVHKMGAVFAAGKAGERDPDVYLKAEEDMLQCSKRWISVFSDAGSVSSGEVTATTLVFMRIMALLAGVAPGTPGSLIVTMTWKKPGDPQTVSFS